MGQPGRRLSTRTTSTSIAQACRDTDRLEFGYTARDGERSERHVEPHRLVLLGTALVPGGMGPPRFDWRSFRLDRLTAPRSTGAVFLPRELPAADAAEFVRSGIDNLPARLEVEALLHADAATVRSRIGAWATVEEIDDARCRLRMTADSVDWVLSTLGATGAEFEVVTPPSVIEHARRWAGRFQRAVERHDHPPSDPS